MACFSARVWRVRRSLRRLATDIGFDRLENDNLVVVHGDDRYYADGLAPVAEFEHERCLVDRLSLAVAVDISDALCVDSWSDTYFRVVAGAGTPSGDGWLRYNRESWRGHNQWWRDRRCRAGRRSRRRWRSASRSVRIENDQNRRLVLVTKLPDSLLPVGRDSQDDWSHAVLEPGVLVAIVRGTDLSFPGQIFRDRVVRRRRIVRDLDGVAETRQVENNAVLVKANTHLVHGSDVFVTRRVDADRSPSHRILDSKSHH